MKRLIKSSLLVLSTLLFSNINAQSSQLRNASSNTLDYATEAGTGTGGVPSWTIAGDCNSNNNTYVQVNTDQAQSKISHFLLATNCGFSIPGGSTITGIQVKVSGFGTIPAGGSNKYFSVQLIKAGSRAGTASAAGINMPVNDDNTYATFGNSSDLWGTTFSASDINASNFGIAIQCSSGTIINTSGNYRWFLDHITVEVWYFPVLPISFESMRANINNNITNIEWNTLSEINHSHYEIERSADNITFISIGSVNGSGNSNIPKSHYYTDKEALPGISYYRIKVVDLDGSIQFYGPLSVNSNKPGESSRLIFKDN